MKPYITNLIALLAGVLVFSSSALACCGEDPVPRRSESRSGPADLGLRDLSADLSNYSQLGDANWSSRGGVISASQGRGFLVSEVHLGDSYVIEFQFKSDENTNSGFFIECHSEISDQDCLEINIFDHRPFDPTQPDTNYRTGGIVHHQSPLVHIDTEGKWNHYRVEAIDNHFFVFLNGIETARIQREPKRSPRPGSYSQHFALQFAGGKIQFKDLRLRRLGEDITLIQLAQRLRQPESKLQGTWELTKFELEDSRGETTQWCEPSLVDDEQVGATGTISYRAGYMYVAINCASDPEKMVHYSGPYNLTEDLGSVVHHVVNASNAEWVGKSFVRSATTGQSGELDLIGPFGVGGRAIVSWKRR